MADTSIEKVQGPIPFLFDLGRPESFMGWANMFRNEDGNIQLVIDMGPKATELLENFVEIAELKVIGFSGIKRKPEQKSKEGDG